MDFVTIHDLSRELNIPARVIRYRFHQLRQSGKLAEGEDFRRDDYVDEQHFTWMINPLSYMRGTATNVAPPPAGYQVDNQSGNKSAPVVNELDTKPAELVIQQKNSGNRTDTTSRDASLEREVIEILKEQMHTKDEQLRTKDGQIKDLSDQMKGVNDLNIKLVGQNVHQAERIQELLKLNGGASHGADVVATSGNKEHEMVNDFDNHDERTDASVVASADSGSQSHDAGNVGQESRIAA